ncbi:03ee65f5-235a-4656-9d16-459c35188747 [Thermothielavioides terrestris]|uniref:03ee65f5-235a-4656-9d16-459c35188747 n=1 Tax=Thermothielavioides terrestris TaxID=2587410 RepID=A0A3S4C3T9_9PEZI|nr:03ee65f5-235a-4656-9d16-459c35188747 [Thermothielavioides terrestris]
MDSPYRRELEAAIAAVQTAAQISREALAAAQTGGDGGAAGGGTFGLVKDDLSPVTVADFAIQAFLTRTLRRAFPQDGFVGEESADQLRQNPKLRSRVLAIVADSAGDAALFRDEDDLCDVIDSCTVLTPAAAGPRRIWVFDPIDGTKTFIRREQYAINIALLEGARQVLSVVACPLLSADATAPVTDGSVDPTGRGCILYAVRGHGAYVRPLLGGGAPDSQAGTRRLPRHADAVTSPAGLRSVTCWALLDSGVDEVHKDVAEALRVPFPGCDLLGWVPRWAVMALGAANMTVWVYKKRDRYAKIWDHAGAMLLFEEVGGLVTDVHGKEIDLAAGRKLKANFGFVAAPKSVHHLVLQAVHDTLKARGREDLLQQ